MSRVERSVDSQFNAFSLFETAIALDHQVRRRTQELQQAMRSIEKAKRQAEAASSLKTTFVTSVGHDLLQPLNAARLALSALGELQVAPGARRADRTGRPLPVDAGRTDPHPARPLETRRRGDAARTSTAFELIDVMEPLARDFAYFAQKRGLKLRISSLAATGALRSADAPAHPAEPARQRLALYLARRRAGRARASVATIFSSRSATPAPA